MQKTSEIIPAIDSGGIRTHEVDTVELESTPFDRSGTLSSIYHMRGSNPRPNG